MTYEKSRSSWNSGFRGFKNPQNQKLVNINFNKLRKFQHSLMAELLITGKIEMHSERIKEEKIIY